MLGGSLKGRDYLKDTVVDGRTVVLNLLVSKSTPIFRNLTLLGSAGTGFFVNIIFTFFTVTFSCNICPFLGDYF
jgi:hypothetical protein